MDTSESAWGIAPVSIYRVPDHLNYNFKYKCYDSHSTLIKEGVITAEETRNSVGYEYVEVEILSIPLWESSSGGALSYRLGFQVVYNSYYYICNGMIEYNGSASGVLTERPPDEWQPDYTDPLYGPSPKVGRLDWIKYFLGTEYEELGDGYAGPGWYAWIENPPSHGVDPPPYGWEYLDGNQPDPPPGI